MLSDASSNITPITKVDASFIVRFVHRLFSSTLLMRHPGHCDTKLAMVRSQTLPSRRIPRKYTKKAAHAASVAEKEVDTVWVHQSLCLPGDPADGAAGQGAAESAQPTEAAKPAWTKALVDNSEEYEGVDDPNDPANY